MAATVAFAKINRFPLLARRVDDDERALHEWKNQSANHSTAFHLIEITFAHNLLEINVKLLVELIHIEYQASQLVVDDLTAMSPGLLHKVVHPERVVDVIEVNLFRVVENLEKTRCD
jgi:hypothetical protein